MKSLQEVKQEHKKKEHLIKSRLEEFSAINGDDIFYEMCFCLLTPQSNGKRCDEIVQVLREKDFMNKEFPLYSHLKKTRFYKNKSKYLNLMKENYTLLKNKYALDKKFQDEAPTLREQLVRNVKGFGYKEASHFLRNIGYRNLAILDRHILKNLHACGVIQELPKSPTPKQYLEIEEKFKQFARKIKIPMDELDLLFWSMETGEVFK